MTLGLSTGNAHTLCPEEELQQSKALTTGCYNVQDISTDHICQGFCVKCTSFFNFATNLSFFFIPFSFYKL